MAIKSVADDWRLEYIIVGNFGDNDFETVSFSAPGKGFATISDANDVLKRLRKASADIGADPPAQYDIHVVTFHKDYGTFELEMPGQEGEDEDH